MASKREPGEEREPAGTRAGKPTASHAAAAQRRLAEVVHDLGELGGRLRALAGELPSTADRDRMLLGAVPRDVATEIWCLVDDLARDQLPRIVARLERASRVTEGQLRGRFTRAQASGEAAPDAAQAVRRAPLPPADRPTLDDLASLFLALDEQPSPRLLSVLLWLIHSDRRTVRLLRRLVHLALDAADPEDAQAVGRPGGR